MTETMAAALGEATPIDPEHYFTGVSFKDSDEVVYGLAEAQLPPESTPPEFDEARVVVAEKIDDADEFGARPVLTVMFEEIDGLDVLPDADEDEQPNEAHAEILIGDADEPHGLPNSIIHSPIDMGVIIKKAMKRYGLERVTASPEDIQGARGGRYRDMGNLLMEAGFKRVESPDETDTYELLRTRRTADGSPADSGAELSAAA